MKKIYIWIVLAIIVLIIGIFGARYIASRNIDLNNDEPQSYVSYVKIDEHGIPQINIDSEYADEISKEILEHSHDKDIDTSFYELDNILSIKVEYTENDNTTYEVYNIDTQTGSKVENDYLLNLYEIENKDDLLTVINKFLIDKIYKYFQRIAVIDTGEFDEEVEEYYQKSSEFFMNEMNDDKLKLFIDVDAKLKVIVNSYIYDNEYEDIVDIIN